MALFSFNTWGNRSPEKLKPRFNEHEVLELELEAFGVWAAGKIQKAPLRGTQPSREEHSPASVGVKRADYLLAGRAMASKWVATPVHPIHFLLYFLP